MTKINHVNRIKTFSTIGFALIFAFLSSVTGAEAREFKTKAKYAVLMDAATGSVLFEANADELIPPASMSKLMTVAIIFEALKKGKLKLTDEIFISENAWRNGGAPSGTSAMFASINSKVALEDILRGIIVQSGNDGCIAIAEHMSGSEASFAERMTAYARAHGLPLSTFKNATGLPADGHLMTAREIGILSLHIIEEYPELYKYFAEKEFKYKRYRFFNRNPLIARDSSVDGLKTGYTKEAGFGLAVSAKRVDRRLVAVVAGLKSKRERASEAKRLIEWGFGSFKKVKLYDENEVVTSLRVWGGSKSYVKVIGENGVQIYLPREGSKKLRSSVVYKGPLKPPIKKGDQVAVFRIITDTGATSEAPLFASEDVEKSGFIWRGFDSLFFLAFGWAYYAL
ncbi:MAG: D-alanyl-D-alanine carboxypeptidase family protein [Methyloligellaceae bacterium]